MGKNKDKIVKNNRVNPLFVEEFEQYLRSMAKKGWYLKKISFAQETFRKGEAKDSIYRIEKAEKNEKDTLVSKYEEQHFTYVTSYKKLHIFVAEEEMARSYQMQKEPKELWKYLYQQRKITAIAMFLLAIILLLGIVVMMGIAKTPWMNLLEAGVAYISIVILIIFFGKEAIGKLRTAFKLKKCMNENKLLQHNADYKKVEKHFGLELTFVMLLLLLNGISTAYSMKYASDVYAGKAQYNLTKETKLPVKTARINDIEQLENPQLLELNTNINEYNNVAFRNHLLYKECTITESIVAMAADNNMHMYSLHTHFYETKLPGTANGIYKELVQQEKENYISANEVEVKTLQSEDFNQVTMISSEQGMYYCLVVRLGNKIAAYQYTGAKQPEEILPLLAKKM